MPKYQQTQPKKQGRNQRGRRPPAMVTVAAKPFDYRKFKAKDYVPEQPDERYGTGPFMAAIPQTREENRKRAEELRKRDTDPLKG